MVYLLVKHPVMLPDGIGQIRFQDSCAEATDIFKEIEASQCYPKPVGWPSLCNPWRQKRNGIVKEMGVDGHVWVEMLCYAACHCPRNHHAEKLRLGGELLTHVWLLMAHFGITEHSFCATHERMTLAMDPPFYLLFSHNTEEKEASTRLNLGIGTAKFREHKRHAYYFVSYDNGLSQVNKSMRAAHSYLASNASFGIAEHFKILQGHARTEVDIDWNTDEN
ncbi:hypothetical protein CK203_082547 [Vitis vinifera]|uniref:Uncharacterized protein n=1 Tax=Vitis vinifera TaxID=29760 RepID=A0A438DK84_VITVI|nr:hypothetical protein CK203_082547 [Vitis vinifera]